MKYLFFAFCSTFLLTACTSTAQDDKNDAPISREANVVTAPIVEKLNVAQFTEKMAEKGENAILLDVRRPKEVEGGAIENSRNINFFDTDFEERVAKMDKEKAIFVYCKSGGRSGRSVAVFKKLGFKEIYDLEGGYDAWAAQ